MDNPAFFSVVIVTVAKLSFHMAMSYLRVQTLDCMVPHTYTHF